MADHPATGIALFSPILFVELDGRAGLVCRQVDQFTHDGRFALGLIKALPGRARRVPR